eukprot:Filipodium_phascolosomae@DN310_c0_g1_i1.p2
MDELSEYRKQQREKYERQRKEAEASTPAVAQAESIPPQPPARPTHSEPPAHSSIPDRTEKSDSVPISAETMEQIQNDELEAMRLMEEDVQSDVRPPDEVYSERLIGSPVASRGRGRGASSFLNSWGIPNIANAMS